jgi:hypothetical protein
MLRYDAAWLLDWYSGETAVAPGVPYMRLAGAGPLEVRREPGDFRLTQVEEFQPVLDYDETVVRLARFESGTLWVQPCAYSDGIRSNYAMDGPAVLRAKLRAEYGAQLPPLADTRLSNAIGTAVIVLDADGRPYLPRRAPRQSVFPGGYHCTASGESVWRDGDLNFDSLFTANICRELEEEVGIARADLEWIRPVALCREFLRGGKPQFFFAAHTKLGAEELTNRRRAAIARQIAAGRQEIMDDVLREARPEHCTIECAANLALLYGGAT